MRKAVNSGFTLVEMAVVLVIIGLVMGAVFPALTAVSLADKRSVTQNNMRSLMLATATYAQANGCVPCPASAAALGDGFGISKGYSTSTPCGVCNSLTAAEPNPIGIPPFVTLGLPASAAHDGGGHWITMRVDPALTKLPANTPTCATTNSCSVFVPPYAACTSLDVTNGFCTSANLNLSAKGLCAAKLKTAAIQVYQSGSSIPQPAAVIFVGHGVNGYGAYLASTTRLSYAYSNGNRLPFPTSDTCPTSGPSSCSTGLCYALCNASGGLRFTDAPQTADYDDAVLYADRNTLVSKFGNGACHTVW